MRDRPIRIGIVGAGANTQARHIPGFRHLTGVDIVVVCNRSDASSRRVAEAFGIHRIARHWEEVVAAPDVDAVVVGTWPSLHAAVSVAALEQGKHVLTEARMACTLEAAERMHHAAARHPELVAQIVPAPMSLEADLTVERLIRSQELGELREVVVVHTTGAYADAAAALHWRLDDSCNGINALTLGIMHEIVQRWLGEDPLWVMADGETFTKSRMDPRTQTSKAVGLPESLSVWGRMPSGARLMYHFSGVEAGAGLGAIHLNGSRACLRFDLASGALYLASVPGPAERLVEIPDGARRGWRVEEDFIQSIRNGDPVRLTSFEQGLRYMRVVDAVWRSWKQGGQQIALSAAGSGGKAYAPSPLTG